MSTLSVNKIKNKGSSVDFPNGISSKGGNLIQGYASSATEPSSAIKGDLWWDSVNSQLYQFINGVFKELSILNPPDWNILGLRNVVTYDGVFFSYTQESTAGGLSFHPDGTKMYISGAQTDKVHQYDLSTSFDITTAVYNNVSYQYGYSAFKSHYFTPDGSILYTTGATNQKFYQHNLSTPYDLSTAVQQSALTHVNGIPEDLVMSPDGTRAFVPSGGIRVIQYELATPFVLSSHTSIADLALPSTPGKNNAFRGIHFNPDGTTLIAVDQAGSTSAASVFMFKLTTPYDIRTGLTRPANTELKVHSLSNQFNSLTRFHDVTFSTYGEKMYILDNNNRKVWQFSTNI